MRSRRAHQWGVISVELISRGANQSWKNLGWAKTRQKVTFTSFIEKFKNTGRQRRYPGELNRNESFVGGRLGEASPGWKELRKGVSCWTTIKRDPVEIWQADQERVIRGGAPQWWSQPKSWKKAALSSTSLEYNAQCIHLAFWNDLILMLMAIPLKIYLHASLIHSTPFPWLYTI